MKKTTTVVALALGACLSPCSGALAAGNDAKGTLIYKTHTAALKYVYLVKGPDAVSKQPIRRLIFSATDLGAKIAACKTMSCSRPISRMLWTSSSRRVAYMSGKSAAASWSS